MYKIISTLTTVTSFNAITLALNFFLYQWQNWGDNYIPSVKIVKSGIFQILLIVFIEAKLLSLSTQVIYIGPQKLNRTKIM